MSHSTDYLYDCEPSNFAYMPYTEALEYKIEQANVLLGRLLKPHHSEREHARIQKATKAINHNKELLNELKDSNDTRL